MLEGIPSNDPKIKNLVSPFAEYGAPLSIIGPNNKVEVDRVGQDFIAVKSVRIGFRQINFEHCPCAVVTMLNHIRQLLFVFAVWLFLVPVSVLLVPRGGASLDEISSLKVPSEL